MEQKFDKKLIIALKAKYEQTKEAATRNRLPVLKLTNGESATVRIMLFEHDGASNLYHEASQHFLQSVPFGCGKSARHTCILCKLADYYKDAGNQKFANRIRVGTRYFVNAVDTTTGKLVVLSLNLSTFNDLMSYFADEEYRPFLVGQTARNVKITRSGEELQTEYHVKVGMKDVTLPEFPECIDFVDYFKATSDEEMLKRAVELIDVPGKFLDTLDDDDTPWEPNANGDPIKDDDEEFPDDDDNKEEFPEDDDEEFPADPPKKSKKKAAPADDEPAPAKKTSKKTNTEDLGSMNPKLAATLAKLRSGKK